jgi:GNAT superfamily N-acetyltransferase
MTDDLYDRGAATVVGSWAALAAATPGAAVHRLPGVDVAVFPDDPERAIYNNAVLARDGGRDTAAAVDAMEATYAETGVTSYAAWVHEDDAPLRAELERRGFTVTETTRAMGMQLDDLQVPRPVLDLVPATWPEHLHVAGVPTDLVPGLDAGVFDVVVARADGEDAATGIAFDLDGDCGVYNVGTREHLRRRGFGTAVTALLVHAARDRGCRTATLQSTPMAERVYAAVGFRDLGRILEHAPPASR